VNSITAVFMTEAGLQLINKCATGVFMDE